jgi:hypothetical protein
MRNALADLTRPARPTALTATVQGRRVTLKVKSPADPRVKYRSFRRRGAQTFQLDAPGVLPRCLNKTGKCVDRNVPPGTYRYAVAAVDDWGRSLPRFSVKIVIPQP